MTEVTSNSALQVFLHPLVLINITDHYTRMVKMGKESRVVGALYGTQEGRRVEINTSFELVFKSVDDNLVIDENYLTTKQSQYSQVFPKYEILGWYSTGNAINLKTDAAIHKQIMSFNENPLFLLMGTEFGSHVKELPVAVYETVLHIVEDQQVLSWAKINYKIETEVSERISVDHVAHIETGGANQGSALVPHYGTLYNAIKMLNARMKLIQAYLEQVKKGALPVNHSFLRSISALTHRLPAVDSNKFQSQFNNDMEDSLLITYLSTLTKGTNVLNEAIDKFNTTYERGRRRGGGMF